MDIQNLRSEPFRLLFPLGMLLGFAGVSHWLFFDLGWISQCSKFLHGALQIHSFLMAFATGFLFTALPRFMSVPPPTASEILVAVVLLITGAIAQVCNASAISCAAFCLLIGTIVVFGARRFPKRQHTPPNEFVLIPFGLAHGFFGGLLQLLYWKGLASPFWFQLGWLMTTQGLFLCLIMGIGGFLGPRLLGFQTLRLEGGRPVVAIRPGPLRMALHALAAIGIFASLVWEARGGKASGQILRAVIVSGELLWTTRVYRWPVTRDSYVLLLWTSFWMVLLGLWCEVLLPTYRIASLHCLFIGGFGLITMSVATMVTMSHLGLGMLLKQRLWVVPAFGVLFLAAMVIRFGADFHPALYFHFLSAAAIAWLAGALAWLVYFIPRIVQGVSSAAQTPVETEGACRRPR